MAAVMEVVMGAARAVGKVAAARVAAVKEVAMVEAMVAAAMERRTLPHPRRACQRR